MIRIFRMTIVTITFILCLTGLVMTGTSFADKCVDNEDGTITDKGTGLMWQKATAGPMDWDQAMSYASGLSLGGHSGWRLPSRDELMSLYTSPCKNMMEVRPSAYWSSENVGTLTAWLLDFSSGRMHNFYKTFDHYYVRAVRRAQ